ncbi:MAG: hypothetical protein Ta2B_06140 [Termitinemataceae bacterium]|nr:MAG: hypothetical protein Ta2B_06140 [Termitinemataceae bacterium]
MSLVFRAANNIELVMLLFIAIMLIAGTIAGRAAVFFRLPQVIGFLAAGLILGRSGAGLFGSDIVDTLSPLSGCVLALICFTIGGSLKLKTLHDNKKQFVSIMLCGSLLPFVVVTALLALFGGLLQGFSINCIAMAFLLGSIAVATAPISITVLKENKTKGPLTTIMQGVIAMDDAAGLLLYTISAALIKVFLQPADMSTLFTKLLVKNILIIAHNVFLPMAVGLICGFLLHLFTLKLKRNGMYISLILGCIFLMSAICVYLGINTILAAVVMGFIVTNIMPPQKTEKVFSLVDQYTPPMIVLFFVLVGAAADVHTISADGGIFALLYLIGRTTGKMIGTTIGAKKSGAPHSVTQNIKFCILNQAGVAMGLALSAATEFPGLIGNTILLVITACVFVVQIVGPICVKFAVKRAGEIDRSQNPD